MTTTYKTSERPNPNGLLSGYNSTGSTIAEGVYVTGHPGAITLPAAIDDPILGVTRAAIPDLSRGPLGSIASGKYRVLVGTGGLTPGARVMPEAATGKGVAWSVTADSNAVITGICVSAANVAAGEYAEVEHGTGNTAQG